MKNFIVLSGILFMFYIVGEIKRDKNFDYYFLDFNHTGIIKGISILLVIWAHVAQLNDVQGLQFIAGAGVSAFLICSGYGIEKSFKKNGLKCYWKKKIINILIPYYLISFTIYFIFHFRNVELGEIVSILTLEKLWYINYQFICYAIFFCVSLLIQKDNKLRIATMCFAFFLWFILDTRFFAMEGAPFLRARQMGAFVSGVIIANRKFESENIIRKYWFLFGSLFCGLIFMIITNSSAIKNANIFCGNVLSLFTTIPLAFAMISSTIIFKGLFKNEFFIFNGMLSYELYLIHYPLLFLTNKGIFVLVFILIIIYASSWLFVSLYDKVAQKMKNAV